VKAETPEERRARVDREERERCLDTFKAPGTWPCWPFLPSSAANRITVCLTAGS